ncbi:hypothetical protein BH11BAC3_BH11BAC3_36160 [soil metagenome]
MKRLITVLLIYLIAGCNNNSDVSSSGIITKEKMEVVMRDIIQASSFTEQFIKKDTLKNSYVENMKLQQRIFLLHHITKEEFYKSYNFYSSQPELRRPILDSIIAMGERKRMDMLEEHSGGKTVDTTYRLNWKKLFYQ